MKTLDEIKDEFKPVIENHLGEDAPTKLMVKDLQGIDVIEMPEGLNYHTYENAKQMVQNPVMRLPWCCLVTTIYMETIPEGMNLAGYTHGDLANSESSIEAHMIHVHKYNSQKIFIFDRENGELMQEITGEEMEGRLT